MFRSILVLLPFFTARCLLANPQSQPDFPSEGEDPHLAGGQTLLAAVCPGRVAVGKEIICQIECPAYTGYVGEQFHWSLTRITRGHFLSPVSDDAVLSMQGCEPHSENFGGSILLTRRSDRWKMVWYKPGLDTETCHKVTRSDNRQILVCIGSYGAQGSRWTALYAVDLLRPTGTLMAAREGEEIFHTFDNAGSCGDASADSSQPNRLVHASIDRVQFNRRAGTGNVVLLVSANFGEKLMTARDLQACSEADASFLPKMTRYDLEFVFDGRDFTVPSASRAAARLFR